MRFSIELHLVRHRNNARSPRDSGALGKHLNQAVPNVKAQRAARRLVEQHFGAQKMSDAYQHLYKGVLNDA